MPAGLILGAYFKAVMGSLLGASAALLFPQHRKRIAEMQDDAWYSMDEYAQMANDLHAKLGDVTMAAIAQASVQKTFKYTHAAGFDTLEKVFGNFDALSRDVVRDRPANESFVTVSLTKSSVVMECGKRGPPAMFLGVFRGKLLEFG